MTRNLRTGLIAGVAAMSMTGVAFAAVPLYQMFCQVTGFAGTTMRADEKDVPGAVQGKFVSVRFDANTAPALPWKFKPERPVDRVAVQVGGHEPRADALDRVRRGLPARDDGRQGGLDREHV